MVLMFLNTLYPTFFDICLAFSPNGVPTLSVKVKNRVKHYKVYHTESGFCIDRARCFPSLLKLVEHYQAYPLVSVERLGKPCIRVRHRHNFLSPPSSSFLFSLIYLYTLALLISSLESVCLLHKKRRMEEVVFKQFHVERSFSHLLKMSFF